MKEARHFVSDLDELAKYDLGRMADDGDDNVESKADPAAPVDM